MKQENFNLLEFLNKKKYVLFLILLISLSTSYFIQYYEKTRYEKERISKIGSNPNLFEFDQAYIEYIDYQYSIWFEKIYPGFQTSIILGDVFEELLIERFFEFKNRSVPGRKSSNNYYYYSFFHNKDIDINDIKKKFEKKRAQFISKQRKLLDKFILQKGGSEFVNRKEYDLFLLNEVELYFKKTKRVQYLTRENYDIKIMQKDPNYQPDLIQSGIPKIPNNIKLNDKLFFHPEVLILLTYFIYFSYYFFRLTIKSKKVS